MFWLVLLLVDHRDHFILARHVCHHFMMRCSAKIGLYGTRLRDGLKPKGEGGNQPEKGRKTSYHEINVAPPGRGDNPG